MYTEASFLLRRQEHRLVKPRGIFGKFIGLSSLDATPLRLEHAAG